MQAEPYSGVQRVLERIEDTLADALACDDLMLDSTREQLASVIRLSNVSLAAIGEHQLRREMAVKAAKELRAPTEADYLSYGVAPLPPLDGSPREAYERVEEWFRSWAGGTPKDYAEVKAVHAARNCALGQLERRARKRANDDGRRGIGWLPLDVSTLNALIRSFYSRIEELAAMSDEELDDINRIGPKRVQAVRVAIERYEMARA